MIIKRECCAPGCDARFETDHADSSRIYCGQHEDRLRAVRPIDDHDHQEAARVPPERECGECGKPFTPGHPRQAYCGADCKRAGTRRRQAESYQRRRGNVAPGPADLATVTGIAPAPARPPAPERRDRLDDVLKGIDRWEAAKLAAGDWTDEDEALRRWIAAGA